MFKFALPTLLLSTAALAQTAPATPPLGDADQIVVTGTRAPGRTVLDSPVPVDVLSAGAIEQAGFQGEVAQALQLLTPSLNFPRQSSSGAGDTVRAAQLRGLSPDQTLVLVNGRRYHTTSVINLETKIGRGTTPVDLNTLPLNAIGRVEVLRDGAGAQYGSDAIAGVIDFVLDRAPGTTASVSYGLNVTDPAAIQQTLTDGQTVDVQVKHGMALGDGGFLVVGGDYLLEQGTNRAGYDQGGQFLTGGSTTDPRNLAFNGQRLFKVGDPRNEGFHLWYNAEVPMGALTLYSYGIGHYRQALGSNFFRWPVLAAGAGGGVSYVSPVQSNGFRPATDSRNSDFQAVAGARATPGEWRLDGSVGYGQNDFDNRLRDSVNYSLGDASPTRFPLFRNTFDQMTVNADAARDIDIGLAKPLTLAFGGEYRREWWRARSGSPASYAVGPLAGDPLFLQGGSQGASGLTPEDARARRRDVFAGYAELSSALTDTVFVDLAGRVEHFADIGKTGVAGKAAARWAFAPGFALRGSVSNSFKAPALAQLGASATTLSFGQRGVLRRVATLPFDNPAAVALGARKLDPETSFNVSAGLTAQPTHGLRLSVDAFRIDIDKRITLSERFDLTGLSDAHRTALGLGTFDAINFFTNAVDLRTQGIEAVADYTTRLHGGTLALSAAYSYFDTSIRRVRPTPPELAANGVAGSLVGLEERNTLTNAAPDSKLVLQSSWQGSALNGLVRLTRFGAMTRVFDFGGGFAPRQTFGADWVLDTEIGVTIAKHYTLAIGANNITDTLPDPSIADINGAGNLAYDVISPIGIDGRFVYARAGLKF